ncbi:MAG: 4'-phosphopantetheinyl transferase superfamily protein [bacterium]
MTLWRTKMDLPALGANELHVWRASLAALRPCEHAWGALLDASERERGARFYFDTDRVRHTISHGLLRRLLGHYTDTPPETLRFAAGEYGKPHLANHDEGRVVFNLSHSGDVVLLAFARSCNVGVDVECWTDRIDALEMERMAQSVFSLHERTALSQLESSARRTAFYSIWSRKEAYIKATGLGVSRGLDHFDVSAAPDEAHLLADRSADARAEMWALHDLELDPGYSAALAVDRADTKVVALNATLSMVSC